MNTELNKESDDRDLRDGRGSMSLEDRVERLEDFFKNTFLDLQEENTLLKRAISDAVVMLHSRKYHTVKRYNRRAL
jgi:uncharacterized coiled-coil DUF342 family protein